MGYFLTTQTRKRSAEKLPASPKTHAPGSRLQERGLRFYNPGVGRWLSRDPIGERALVVQYSIGKSRKEQSILQQQALMPVYLLCANSPVSAYDILGLMTSSECYSNYFADVKAGMAKAGRCVFDELGLPLVLEMGVVVVCAAICAESGPAFPACMTRCVGIGTAGTGVWSIIRCTKCTVDLVEDERAAYDKLKQCLSTATE